MKQTDLPPKNSDEFLDYSINWANTLGSDIIVSYTANAISNTDSIVVSNTWTTNTRCYFWLANGSVGETSKIHHVIHTANNRIYSITTNITISE